MISRMQNNKKQWKKDIDSALPIIDGRLYFTMSKNARNTENIHMFSVDHALRYEPFFVDFGPLNLACLYKFCKLLQHKLADKKHANSKIYYYCDRTPQRVSNAAYLIGAFQIIEMSRAPKEAYSRIKPLAEKGVPFRDASMGLCTYPCTPKHCINALYHGVRSSFLDFTSFNVDEYEHYERVECGDLNVIIPNKFIAFAGPYFKEFDEEGYPALTPDFYIPIWKKFKVSTIIRLNKKCYDKRIFTKAGFDHYDLYFIDGTTPSDQIINKFISICETSVGTLAVHCKAGLGRTGSCVGCYMMKHYAWTAAQTIAWLRMCRPGSVIGPQQHFLEEKQAKMWKEGDQYRKKHQIILKYDPRCDPKLSNSSLSNMNNNNNNNDEYKENDINNSNNQPLPTDPGQNQGATLKHAKAQHQNEHHPNNHTTNQYSHYNLNNNKDDKKSQHQHQQNINNNDVKMKSNK